MSDILILYVCQDCQKEHYFEPDSLPGGLEHCEYCEKCSGILVKNKDQNIDTINQQK